MGTEDLGLGLDEPRLGLLELPAGDHVRQGIQPADGRLLQRLLSEGLEQLGLRPADLYCVHPSKDLAGLHTVSNVLLDSPDGPRHA